MVNGNRTSKFQEQKKVTVPPIKSQRYLSDVVQNEGNKDKDNTLQQGNKLCDGENEQIHPSETTNGVNTCEENKLANMDMASASTNAVNVII